MGDFLLALAPEPGHDAGGMLLGPLVVVRVMQEAGDPPNVRVGLTLAVFHSRGPHGDFRAQDSAREMALIGGGVGMAPLRAIIHERLGQGAPPPISFWYGARRRDDLFYAEEFAALARQHPEFRVEVALSDPRPGDRWEGWTGFVHAALRDDLLRDHAAPEACDYYLCGPPLMIAAVMGVLDEAGVPPSRIFFDDFGS